MAHGRIDVPEILFQHAWYNAERTNQDRYCQGRTPLQTFLDGIELYQQYVYENPVEEKEMMM